MSLVFKWVSSDTMRPKLEALAGVTRGAQGEQLPRYTHFVPGGRGESALQSRAPLADCAGPVSLCCRLSVPPGLALAAAAGGSRRPAGRNRQEILARSCGAGGAAEPWSSLVVSQERLVRLRKQELLVTPADPGQPSPGSYWSCCRNVTFPLAAASMLLQFTDLWFKVSQSIYKHLT